MRTVVKVIFIVALLLLALKLFFIQSPRAPVLERPSSRYSGLPLPRFVSLKATRSNIRVGPGSEYRIAWTFVKKGLPVEVIQEYDNWRYIRDHTGAEGWIYGALLSGARSVLISPQGGAYRSLYKAKSEKSLVVAKLAPGALGRVVRCDGAWCQVRFPNVEGWIKQAEVWGVYDQEQV